MCFLLLCSPRCRLGHFLRRSASKYAHRLSHLAHPGSFSLEFLVSLSISLLPRAPRSSRILHKLISAPVLLQLPFIVLLQLLISHVLPCLRGQISPFGAISLLSICAPSLLLPFFLSPFSEVFLPCVLIVSIGIVAAATLLVFEHHDLRLEMG